MPKCEKEGYVNLLRFAYLENQHLKYRYQLSWFQQHASVNACPVYMCV